MEKGGAPNLSQLYQAAQIADEKSRSSVLTQTVQRISGGDQSVNNVYSAVKHLLKSGDVEAAHRYLAENPTLDTCQLVFLIE